MGLHVRELLHIQSLIPLRFICVLGRIIVVLLVIGQKDNILNDHFENQNSNAYSKAESSFTASLYVCLICLVVEFMSFISGISFFKHYHTLFSIFSHALGGVLTILDHLWHPKDFVFIMIFLSLPVFLDELYVIIKVIACKD